MAVKQLHLFCFKAGLDSANYVNEISGYPISVHSSIHYNNYRAAKRITTEQLSAMIFVTYKLKLDESEVEQADDRQHLKRLEEISRKKRRQRHELQQ